MTDDVRQVAEALRDPRPIAVSALIHQAAGSPSQEGITVGMCRLCGCAAQGLAWEMWVRETFTDHDKVQPGTIVCHACQFCADDHNTVLQARTGREKPQRMRNYSHVVTDAGWRPYMKNEKRALAQALLNPDAPPRAAVISLAGQKHLILRAAAGMWQIEESAMWPDPAGLARLLTPVEALYAAGASKAMIESGAYTHAWLRTVSLPWWSHIEAQLRHARGSLLFQLAVWLAQRDEDHDDRDTRPRDGAPDANLDGYPERVQDQVQVHDLASVRGPSAQRRVHDDAQSLSQPDLFAAERDAP